MSDEFIRMRKMKAKEFGSMGDFITYLRRQKSEQAQSLATTIMQSGGRAFFDPFCSEWKDLTEKQKLEFFKIALESGVRLRALVYLYKGMWKNKRKDVTDVVEDALIDLLEYCLLNRWTRKKAKGKKSKKWGVNYDKL